MLNCYVMEKLVWCQVHQIDVRGASQSDPSTVLVSNVLGVKNASHVFKPGGTTTYTSSHDCCMSKCQATLYFYFLIFLIFLLRSVSEV